MVVRFFLSGFFVAVAFFGVDMEHDRMIDVFDRLEGFDQFYQIISFLEVAVIKAQCSERIVGCFPICRAQLGQRTVEAAEILID